MRQRTKNNRKWWVLQGSTLLYLATAAGGPNLNVAIPSIQDYFSASATQVQLLTSTAAMFMAAFGLAAGSFIDLYGRRRIFITGGFGLIINLVLQAISPSVGFLTSMQGLDRLFSGVSQVVWVGAAVVTVGAVLAWINHSKGE